MYELINDITPKVIEEFTYSIILFVNCAIIYYILNKSIIKDKWFKSLKAGDLIQVKIFSQDCECFAQAKVLIPVDRYGYVTAKVIKDSISCDECDSVTYYCWKDIISFKKRFTKPI
jgi:hypothetical protein